MKKLALAATAAATLVLAAAPAMAQVGIYVGPGGVGFGAPYYQPYGYYNSYPGPRFVARPGWRRYHHYRHW